MENITQFEGYPVYEYKIVLVPHRDLADKIAFVKKEFNQKYKIEAPVIAIPQLILARFSQTLVAQPRIINRLRLVAMTSHPVKIELKDFGSYPSHTIFINVTSKVPVSDLVKKIREDTQRLMKLDNDNKPHFIIDAQMTIAMKLKPWQYEQGWLEYSHKHFTGKFIADKLLLFRRKKGEFKYTLAETFQFQNLPIDIKQGELFG